ncbi:MAG: transcription elongation factor GreA [Ruminococcaceae bacterium]|nr:transcription elongation factor GreA [Oscillospiraceae bacterium]
MAEKQRYTREGFLKLQEEYDLLTKVKREEVKKAIAEARSFGDLSENSEYDEARNEQAKIETRIKELEELIRNAEITSDDDMDEGVVGLGSTVKLVNNGAEVVYSIVGSNEANPFENKISDMSLIGKALIGKRAGDELEIKTNAGQVVIKVLEVSRAK